MESTPLMHQIPEAARRLGIGRSLFYELLKDRGVAVVKLCKLADNLIAEARAKVST